MRRVKRDPETGELISSVNVVQASYFDQGGTPMSERARQSIKAWKAQFAAEQESARLAAEKPLRDTELRLQDTANALGRAVKERILTGVDYDGFKISDEERSNIDAVQEFALAGNDEMVKWANQIVYDLVKKFSVEYDLPLNESNIDTITSYLQRNLVALGYKEVNYAPFTMWCRAIARLRLYHCLGEVAHIVVSPRESVEKEAQEQEAREAQRQAQQDVEAADTASRTGIDPLTGEPKVYTKTEVKRMSADDYKKARIGGTVLPTFTDVFSASEQREGR